MPIDIQTIAGYLESHSLKFQMRQSETGSLFTRYFQPNATRNTQGDKHLHLYIDTGRKRRVFVWCRQIIIRYRRKVFNGTSITLLMISSKSKMVQFRRLSISNGCDECRGRSGVCCDRFIGW